ncbi:DNA mismatch repair protein MutS, partial [Thioclava sp. BHET1]
DMDRALSRLALDRGGPRDLAAIRGGLTQAGDIANRMGVEMPAILSRAAAALTGHEELVDLLDQALIAEPPLLARDGGYIAPGYDAELDETRSLRDEGRGVIARMQAEYIEATGINSLKIKHNNVLGYFIETTANHAEK